MYKFLFIDLDDTILDFKKSEHKAIRKTLREAGIEPTDAVCARYSAINKGYWERLERKEVTRAQLQVGRFADLMAEYGIQGDAKACADRYMENLSEGTDCIPGAVETLKRFYTDLRTQYKRYLVTNGNLETQVKRIQNSGLVRYFTEVYISGAIGVDKPDKEFFRYCFTRIPDFDPKQAMIIGDSLTSDILGGKNAGIATCWVNPDHKVAPPELQPDYEIENITQLEALLESL